jgi:hypothetical protein
MNGARLDVPLPTVGAIAELAVAVDLMRRGFSVYRALSPASDCDLAVVKDQQLLRVEVKAGTRQGENSYRANVRPEQEGKFDVLAIYLPAENLVVYKPSLD